MNKPLNSAVLDHVLGPLTECLTPEVAARIAALRASTHAERRIEELAEKSTAGTLSEDERVEYETWVRALNFLGILQARARKVASHGAA